MPLIPSPSPTMACMLRCLLALCALPLLAQQNQAPAPKTPDETPVVRQHEITLKGRTLKYTTTTGLMPIRNAEGVTEAHILYMAYTLDGEIGRASCRERV